MVEITENENPETCAEKIEEVTTPNFTLESILL